MERQRDREIETGKQVDECTVIDRRTAKGSVAKQGVMAVRQR